MMTRHEPILLDYETYIPFKLFGPLLLPDRSQLERLAAIERHIASRKWRSKHGYPSIFSSYNAENCIAV